MTQLFATLLRHSCLDGHFAHLHNDFCRLSLGDIPIVTEVSMILPIKIQLFSTKKRLPHFNVQQPRYHLKGYIQFRWP